MPFWWSLDVSDVPLDISLDASLDALLESSPRLGRLWLVLCLHNLERLFEFQYNVRNFFIHKYVS